ncbi:copper chaperone PCu(A)C [Streptomyces hirsutus]|uniref:copper chaperone PCu(A)C n=1 Tax=Streptomyces hirsutus TaxID=35620 RepID=UPI0006E2ED13|nr:copper chaperone PCu(A)C [Streptomyces hirsutus]
MSERHPWRPTRRLTDTLVAALAPVTACAVALGGLTVWVGTGQAGTPAHVDVTEGRVFLPYGDTRDTAAFFDLTNSGDADDRLVEVTSAATDGDISLSRHRAVGDGAAAKETVESATVPADGELAMSPHGVDVTLRAGERWQVGDRVPFTLHFEHTGPVEAVAVVVRPAS